MAPGTLSGRPRGRVRWAVCCGGGEVRVTYFCRSGAAVLAWSVVAILVAALCLLYSVVDSSMCCLMNGEESLRGCWKARPTWMWITRRIAASCNCIKLGFFILIDSLSFLGDIEVAVVLSSDDDTFSCKVLALLHSSVRRDPNILQI